MQINNILPPDNPAALHLVRLLAKRAAERRVRLAAEAGKTYEKTQESVVASKGMVNSAFVAVEPGLNTK